MSTFRYQPAWRIDYTKQYLRSFSAFATALPIALSRTYSTGEPVLNASPRVRSLAGLVRGRARRRY
jgi:hypothetical protein